MSWSNVEELDIALPMDRNDERLSVSIPSGIFTSNTLVSLLLSLVVDWIVPNSVCLPNLKFLMLKKFRLVDEDSIRRFLQGCPALETLYLQPFHYASGSEEGVEVKVVDISSPLLKYLILYGFEDVKSEFTIFVKSKNLEVLNCFFVGQHKVTIDAPNLTSFSIKGPEVNIIQNLMSLDYARVQAGFLYYGTTEGNLFLHSQHVFKFFSGLQNVKSLCLSEDVLKVLKNYFIEGKEFDSVFQEALPIASIEHLKEIEISKFKGDEHEFKLVEYLLKNGNSLKKMAFVRESWNSVSEGCGRILSFKKCSEDCQIVFKKKWA